MDIIFECPHCKQELSIDSAGAGSEIECPSCTKVVRVPETEDAPANAAPASAPAPAGVAAAAAPAPGAPGGVAQVGKVINAMATSAAAKEVKHFVVPVHAGPTESLIAKPLPTLDVAAKDTERQVRVKSFRHSDHVEVGKDHFDEHVCQFLGRIGEENIMSIHPFNYTHQELASRAWITDYGILVVYKG